MPGPFRALFGRDKFLFKGKFDQEKNRLALCQRLFLFVAPFAVFLRVCKVKFVRFLYVLENVKRQIVQAVYDGEAVISVRLSS
mgnify:CR=1 FL=1